MNPTSMVIGIVIGTKPTVRMLSAQIAVVIASTGRMPHTPIHRLVSGPAIAWPTLVAASTSPAAP